MKLIWVQPSIKYMLVIMTRSCPLVATMKQGDEMDNAHLKPKGEMSPLFLGASLMSVCQKRKHSFGKQLSNWTPPADSSLACFGACMYYGRQWRRDEMRIWGRFNPGSDLFKPQLGWASKSWCRQGTSKYLQSQLQLIKARHKQIFTIEITIDKRKVQAAIYN